MRAFICDYAKTSPAVLADLVTCKIYNAWANWADIDEDKFELQVMEPTSPVDWDKVRKLITPYLYRE